MADDIAFRRRRPEVDEGVSIRRPPAECRESAFGPIGIVAVVTALVAGKPVAPMIRFTTLSTDDVTERYWSAGPAVRQAERKRLR